MATEEEKQIARAYNIGYALSAYEPRLLDQFIRQNKDNGFVKAMAVARDHQEFNRGIPRKDFTKEYKNGFHNAKTLIENNPNFFDQLINAKDTNSDLKRGLKAGRNEYEILKTVAKVREQPKLSQRKTKEDFQKGFNTGYTLSRDYGDTLKFVIEGQKKYGAFVEGLDAGQKQYNKEKHPDISLDKKESTPELSDEIYFRRRSKAKDLEENMQGKMDLLAQNEIHDNKTSITDIQPPSEDELNEDGTSERQSDLRLPWLRKTEDLKQDISKKEDKNKDIEPEI